MSTDINFEALERLVGRCKSLKVLKVNRNVTLEQLSRLIIRAPLLTELGTGSFFEELPACQHSELENAFSKCKNLNTLSMSDVTALSLPAVYPACTNLTFLNLSSAALQSVELANLLVHCPQLRRLWVRNLVFNIFTRHLVFYWLKPAQQGET